MPKGVRGSSTTASLPDMAKLMTTPRTKQANRSVPKEERKVEVLHHGVGSHSMGSIINESVLGDRANLRRLTELGAVRLHVPAPVEVPDLEDEDDLEDAADELEAEDETEDSSEDDTDENEEEPSTPTVRDSLATSSPLLSKVFPANVKTTGAVPPAAPAARDSGKA